MKNILLALTIAAAVPLYAEKGKLPEAPRQVTYKISDNDTFTVTAEPGWKLESQHEEPMHFGSVRLTGPDNALSFQLTFIRDTADMGKFNTPEKLLEFQEDSSMRQYVKSLERKKKIPYHNRSFTPAGRFGYVTRSTDKKSPLPVGEWMYATMGFCRVSNDSVMGFVLLTNSLDDQEYVKILDYIASFIVPEPGEKGWKVADAAEANKIASAEFAKRYPESDLLTQRPYSVKREGTKWIVDGNMWNLTKGGCAHAEIDGPSGKILEVGHYK